MGIVSAADEHSPTTAGRQDSAHSGPQSFLRDHSGQQTYGQSPAILSPPKPGSPAHTSIKEALKHEKKQHKGLHTSYILHHTIYQR